MQLAIKHSYPIDHSMGWDARSGSIRDIGFDKYLNTWDGLTCYPKYRKYTHDMWTLDEMKECKYLISSLRPSTWDDTPLQPLQIDKPIVLDHFQVGNRAYKFKIKKPFQVYLDEYRKYFYIEDNELNISVFSENFLELTELLKLDLDFLWTTIASKPSDQLHPKTLQRMNYLRQIIEEVSGEINS